MAALAETKHAAPPKEILRQLGTFVRGCNSEGATNEDLITSALFLLQTLPSSRQAVLEYLSKIFNEAVGTYIQRISLYGDSNGHVHEASSTEVIVERVHHVLLAAVRNNPRAWGPIIAAWSMDLLGQISSEYSGRYMERRSSGGASLNELLQLWMTCTASKTLIEIASESFASMVASAPDICVDNLLEASVKYSPHFDWVVAHIGSCFPQTIIVRVLECGLKDYSNHDNKSADSSQVMVEAKIPKMASVKGILGYLAAQHGRIIRSALVEMFQRSLEPSASDTESCTIPFLLHLASLSPMLQTAMMLEFVACLSPQTLNKIGKALTKTNITKEQDVESILGLVIHLLSTSEEAAFQMLSFLLDTAYPKPTREDAAMDTDEDGAAAAVVVDQSVQQMCERILLHLVVHLQKAVHSKPNEGNRSVPFMSGLQAHVDALAEMVVVETDENRQSVLSNVLLCVAVSGSESLAAEVLSLLVASATTNKPLSLFIGILREADIKHRDVAASCLQHILDLLQQNRAAATTTLANLNRLVEWEREQTSDITRMPLSRYLRDSLPRLVTHLYQSEPSNMAAALKLLHLVGLPPKLPSTTVTHLCTAMVDLVFSMLALKDLKLKVTMCTMCENYLKQLTCYPSAQKTVIRLLLEGAVIKSSSVTVGGKRSPPPSASDAPGAALLSGHQNTDIGSTQASNVAFHAGIIGQGLKPLPRPSPYTNEEQFHNQQMFMGILSVCSCHRNNINQSAAEREAAAKEERKLGSHIGKFLALQVIELVTPDVMYNGIPWPEEEFLKVTVERDLLVKKKFENHPVLWAIMEFVASGPGSMCYCSVLLRSVMATLLSHWERSRDNSATNSPWQLQASTKIIEFMKMGDLLPPPLSYTGELLSSLSPFEVYLLLLNLWRYMKENPPVPEPRDWGSIGCDPRYTEVIRSILHANIGKLGHLYPRFFSANLPGNH